MPSYRIVMSLRKPTGKFVLPPTRNTAHHKEAAKCHLTGITCRKVITTAGNIRQYFPFGTFEISRCVLILLFDSRSMNSRFLRHAGRYIARMWARNIILVVGELWCVGGRCQCQPQMVELGLCVPPGFGRKISIVSVSCFCASRF